jgi:hypothetical protein
MALDITELHLVTSKLLTGRLAVLILFNRTLDS